MPKKIAYYIADLKGFTGTAKLYKLNIPIKYITSYEHETYDKTSYVVVSATYAMYSGNETYIFPSDEDGKVTYWGELDGSYRGGLDHNKALEDAGYGIRKAKQKDIDRFYLRKYKNA